MRAIPRDLDASVVAEIESRLAGVALAHDVRIPWAIESGSRAWGFPSPDSDYDCRFLFVRSPDRYLTLWPGRDVIETPLDAVFDVNGWDLAKAVRLITKGNATAIEWLRSPIVYSGDVAFRDRLVAFAGSVLDRTLIGRHYLHVALQQRRGPQTLKRFFYVLRPAAALRWLADHPDAGVPPMNLVQLLAESSVPSSVRDAVGELIEAKRVMREAEVAERPDILERFVEREIAGALHFDTDSSSREHDLVRARADQFFRSELA